MEGTPVQEASHRQATLSLILKAIRGRRGLRSFEVARLTGMALRSYQRFESGARGVDFARIHQFAAVADADGTRLHLNTDSRVKVRFRAGERRLVLARGEALFDVAHDPQRPFIVTAGDTRVRALGTRFDVRRDDATVRVSLLEGSVRVRRDDQPGEWTLAPNQQLTVTRSGPATPHAIDAARTTSWTTGRLVFHETPLAAAIAEVNRYAERKVELQADDLAARRVNGVFDVGDTDSFVKGVSALFDLKATPAPGGSIRLQPADPAAAA